MPRKRGRSKTISQALDQRNKLYDYYANTGRQDTADRILRGTTGVGGVVGNMADRIAMEGGDYTDYRNMRIPISFEDRTTTPTEAEYNAAVKRNKKPTKKLLNAQAKAELIEKANNVLRTRATRRVVSNRVLNGVSRRSEATSTAAKGNGNG